MNQKQSKPCPCSPEQTYANCCAPLHQGTQKAETAEQLMRSRYSAFALCNEPYLKNSLHPDKQKKSGSKIELTPDLNWNGLDIIKTNNGRPTDKIGKVEFKAWYFWDGKQECLHERSRFKKYKGHWYYWDGEMY